MGDNISKEAVEAIVGQSFKITVRRGNNFQIQFAELGAFAHVNDDEGNEVMSRDESILRTQIEQLDALREAGVPARISNIRKLSPEDIKRTMDAGNDIWSFSPSIWVNQPGSSGRSTAALEAKLAQQTNLLERVLAALSPEQAAAITAVAAQAPVAPVAPPADEVPL